MKNPLPLLMTLLLFTACTPAGAAEPTQVRITELPEPTPAPSPTIDPGVALVPPVDEAPPTESVAGPGIDLSWTDASGNVLIEGTFCCGFTTPEFVRNALPEFRIWADGRYIWVEHDDAGGRQVYETRLSQADIDAIIQRAAGDGFFGWKERYANDLVADLADKCLIIRLPAVTKSVCEYYEGAPDAFHALFADLAHGSGRAGKPFIPARAFLSAAVFDVDFVSPNLLWQDAGLSLAKVAATDGEWVDGDALGPLWKTVNAVPWGPIVEENGVYYLITLQVDDLSLYPVTN